MSVYYAKIEREENRNGGASGDNGASIISGIIEINSRHDGNVNAFSLQISIL